MYKFYLKLLHNNNVYLEKEKENMKINIPFKSNIITFLQNMNVYLILDDEREFL